MGCIKSLIYNEQKSFGGWGLASWENNPDALGLTPQTLVLIDYVNF